MSHKVTIFYRGRTAISIDFSANEISYGEAVLLLKKLEKKHRILRYFRLRRYQRCPIPKNAPPFERYPERDLASQPMMSRFENSDYKHSVFALCYAWVDRYVDSLKGRSQVIIDIDTTDDPAYGNQQLSMFNGYSCFMHNELFFHDVDTSN